MVAAGLFVGRRGKCDPVTSRSLVATLARVLHTLPTPPQAQVSLSDGFGKELCVYPLPLVKLNSINVRIIREDQVIRQV